MKSTAAVCQMNFYGWNNYFFVQLYHQYNLLIQVNCLTNTQEIYFEKYLDCVYDDYFHDLISFAKKVLKMIAEGKLSIWNVDLVSFVWANEKWKDSSSSSKWIFEKLEAAGITSVSVSVSNPLSDGGFKNEKNSHVNNLEFKIKFRNK